ncbi:Gfo/Idh/MocA family oxidoreductase [Nocardioides sp. JQ2195]|uniref:Gfo/Idh/MocA family protein n=1 Tax=Nocardioides sp. JQ2195 TaxID=2592334 RepID=UPI00143E2683|nr:Gfo/Idh/MocA family oxidoreductase [Nocardioides sp. JQ2195]QIX28231.1 Gfo/Idh/MocA family oxidoreductase [Nocardioides sp. JQ2195]
MTAWGILATGKIARKFATALHETPGARLTAVGSRTPGKARHFADTFGTGDCTAHSSYEALVRDPSVDVIYVASPHSLHLPHAKLAFEAGKHVLCEKPLTLNVADAVEMVRLAAEHDRFLMEGMWTLCHPLVIELKRRLDSGAYGVPRQVHADLGWRVDAPPTDRMLNPALGGGALLDMGIYPLTFAQLVLGRPEQLTAVADLAPTGVDLDVSIAGRHVGGGTSALSASMTAWTSRTATIATTTGWFDVAADFHHPSRVVWRPHVGEPVPVVAADPVIGDGYGNEAAEVMRCIDSGLRESPLVPHAFTLDVMAQMDALRRQIKVVYPSEH